MPWVRIDDHFDQHAKFAKAGPLGLALWVAGLAYCNRTLSDGFIPWTVARTLLSWEFLGPEDETHRGRQVYRITVSCGMVGDNVGPEFVVNLLVVAGLWEEVDGGYQVHDYEDYQPLKSEVEADKAKKIEAGRAGGIATAAARATATDTASNKGSAVAKAQPVPNPGPGPGPLSTKDSEFSHENSAALTRSPAGSYQDLHDRLRAEKNKPAVMTEAIGAWYGVECKEFGRIARLGGQFGFGELLKIALKIRPDWNGIDNPLDYIQATAIGKKNSKNGHVVARQPTPSETEGMPDVIDWKRYDAEGAYWDTRTDEQKAAEEALKEKATAQERAEAYAAGRSWAKPRPVIELPG